MNQENKVIYIIGDRRSGSTLLDYLLGSHPDAVSVGELNSLHNHFFEKGIGKSREWQCSCGTPVKNCDFWRKIIGNASFSEEFLTDFEKNNFETKKQQNKFNSNKYSVNHTIDQLKNESTDAEGQLLANNIWSIYNTIFEQTGKKLIIDSSKNAENAYFLGKYKKGNIGFILLERDIWEVALSKKKRIENLSDEIKKYRKKKDFSISRVILSSYIQFRKNRAIVNELKKLKNESKIKQIQYTKLSTYPQETIEGICRYFGISNFDVPKMTNQYNKPVHAIGGSPSRYESKPIQPDKRWKSFYKKHPTALLFAKLLMVFKSNQIE